MRIGMLIVGLVLFSFGVAMLLAFTVLSDYIITLYPLSGYFGLGIVLVSFALLYKGIFSMPPYRYEVVASASSSEEEDHDLDTFEEWESEESVFFS